MSEERKDYSKGWLGDILDAGASRRLNPKNDDLKDARDMLTNTEYNVLVGSGVREDEAQDYLDTQLAQNESDHASTAKSIKTMSTTNTIINVASLVPVASKVTKGAGSKIAASLRNSNVGTALSTKLASGTASMTAGELAKEGANLMKNGQVLKGMGMYAKAGTHLVGNAASKVGKVYDTVDDTMHDLGRRIAGGDMKMLTQANKWVPATMSTSGKFISALPKANGLLGTAQSIVGFGVSNTAYIAPIVAAQMYTHGRVDAMDKDLSDAITLALDRMDYLNVEGPKLTGEAGEAYTNWNDTYSASMADLANKLETGEITRAQYDRLYEEQSRAQADALKELDGKYPEMARQMVTEGEAYRVADTAATIQADLDGVGKYDSQVKGFMEDYPEAKELYQEKYDKIAELDTGSTFGNFISSMHAALVHYLPGVAYLEAAVVKGADVALGFVANNVPVLSDVIDYKEHYQGQSLTSMASQIVDTAEARYEKQDAADAISEQLANKQQSWQDAAKETREAGDGEQAIPG